MQIKTADKIQFAIAGIDGKTLSANIRFFGFYLFTICAVSEWVIATSVCACERKKNHLIRFKWIWWIEQCDSKQKHFHVIRLRFGVEAAANFNNAIKPYMRCRTTPLFLSTLSPDPARQISTKSCSFCIQTDADKELTHTQLPTEWVSELVSQSLLMPVGHALITSNSWGTAADSMTV